MLMIFLHHQSILHLQKMTVKAMKMMTTTTNSFQSTIMKQSNHKRVANVPQMQQVIQLAVMVKIATGLFRIDSVNGARCHTVLENELLCPTDSVNELACISDLERRALLCKSRN